MAYEDDKSMTKMIGDVHAAVMHSGYTLVRVAILQQGEHSMIETTTSRRATIAAVIRVLIAAEAIAFLLAALLHTGIQFLPGFVEPRNTVAAIVEGFCGIFLMVSAYAVFARKAWGWKVAIAAHVFAVAAVLLGITVIALGSNPGGDEANNIFHRII